MNDSERLIRFDWAMKKILRDKANFDILENNQKIIDNNANTRGGLVRGSVRSGRGLLAGLLRCGHCGKRLYISYWEGMGDRI